MDEAQKSFDVDTLEGREALRAMSREETKQKRELQTVRNAEVVEYYEQSQGAAILKMYDEQEARRKFARAAAPVPGGCTRDTFRCHTARNMRHETPECCRRHIRAILSDVGALLDEFGIRWWVDYGTLLGVVRHGGLIPWDKDSDLGILAEDRQKLLGLLPQFMRLGYFPTYAKPKPGVRFRTGDRVKVRLSARNHTNCDIFIWEPRPNGMRDRINYIGADVFKGRAFPESWLLPLGRGDFDGVDVSMPADPIKLVEHRYGPGWETPEQTKHPAEPRGDWKAEQ